MFKELLSIEENQKRAVVSGATVANNMALLSARQRYWQPGTMQWVK